jgi:hypothetical protein
MQSKLARLEFCYWMPWNNEVTKGLIPLLLTFGVFTFGLIVDIRILCSHFSINVARGD